MLIFYNRIKLPVFGQKKLQSGFHWAAIFFFFFGLASTDFCCTCGVFGVFPGSPGCPFRPGARICVLSAILHPECKQEVSSAAPACPHCGYPLQKKAAPLGEIQRHRTIGMVFLALGFAAVFGGLILAFTWSLLSILGALLIIGGSALMSMGYLQTTGFYNVSCPQCGAQGTLSPRARVWKCPQCKCRSLRQGDALEEE